MGADLIITGYTVKTTGPVDLGDVWAALMSIDSDELVAHAESLGGDGEFYGEWEVERDDDDESILDNEHNRAIIKSIRDAVAAGAQWVGDTSRFEAAWIIPDTDLTFVVSGGTSWGDDPWEGWSDLCRFLTACELFPELGEPVGLVCGGLPDATTVALHRYK